MNNQIDDSVDNLMSHLVKMDLQTENSKLNSKKSKLNRKSPPLTATVMFSLLKKYNYSYETMPDNVSSMLSEASPVVQAFGLDIVMTKAENPSAAQSDNVYLMFAEN